MEVTPDEVRKIADLSKLSFQAEDLERFARQFQQILDYFRQLETIPTEDVEPTYHALQLEKLETPMRDDRTVASLPMEGALRNAPAALDGQFRVPKVIE